MKQKRTSQEKLRVKAYLIVRRNTTRDYIDFVALFDHLGVSRAVEALRSLDRLYPQESGTTVSQQLALQLAEPKPWDLSQTDLHKYKSLQPPYTDWNEVQRRALTAGKKLMADQLQR